jgi:hypothetical protein
MTRVKMVAAAFFWPQTQTAAMLTLQDFFGVAQ